MVDPTEPADAVEVAEQPGGAVVLAVSGDLDYVTTPGVRKRLLGLLDKRPALVVLDLLRLSFLGSAGLALLAETAHVYGAQIPLRIAVGTHALRTIRVTGLDGHLGLYPTVEEALAASDA